MSAAAFKPKRRVNSLTRERARERMMALPEEERKARAAKARAAKAAKRTPEAKRQQLVELTARIDALGAEFRSLPAGDPRRREIIHELRGDDGECLAHAEQKLREEVES